MKYFNKGSAVVVAIIGIIVLAVIGGVVWYVVSDKAENSIANWKTYTNKEYGFEIKYPSNWTIDEQSYKDNNLGTIVSGSIDFIDENSIKNANIMIISEQDINKLIPIWFSGVEIVKQEDKKINDINYRKVYFEKKAEERTEFLTEKNGKIYEIKNILTETENIFNQILSTFKFTE